MTAPRGILHHFADLPHMQRVHMITLARGSSLLAACFVAPITFRALALHFRTIEHILHFTCAPEMTAAWLRSDYIEIASEVSIHGAGFVTSLAMGTSTRLGAGFVDLIRFIEATGQMIGAGSEQRRLTFAVNQYHLASQPGARPTESGFLGRENIGRSGLNYTSVETYRMTKLLEVMVRTAAIAALLFTAVAVSPWGEAFAVTAEVTFAGLSILHYMYEGHARNYPRAMGEGYGAASNSDFWWGGHGPGGPGDDGSGGPGDCSAGKGTKPRDIGDKAVHLEASVANTPPR